MHQDVEASTPHSSLLEEESVQHNIGAPCCTIRFMLLGGEETHLELVHIVRLDLPTVPLLADGRANRTDEDLVEFLLSRA
jgi:hypothetical protein